MSYAASGLRLMIPRIGSGPALFFYHTTDAHTDVDADNYFTDGADMGMKVNDVVIVVDTDTNTCTVHMVSTVSASTKDATIAAATLT
jgi:hypothetical protein